MAKKKNKPTQPSIGDNSINHLTGFVEDWHRLDRDDLFARGELLIKAHDTHAYQDWRKVCKTEFDISHDTALNLMRIAKVAARYENFRHLKVRKSTLYELAGIGEEGGVSNKDLPAIIQALTEAGKVAGKTLSIEAADDVLYFIPLRKKYGNDVPNATLIALKEMVPGNAAWGPTAIRGLKKHKYETNGEVEAFISGVRRSHLEELFGAPLPVEDDALSLLEFHVDEQDRVRVLAALQGAESQSLDEKEVRHILFNLNDDASDAGDADAGEPPDTPNSFQPSRLEPIASEPLSNPETQETDQQRAIEAAAAIEDIGGKAEIERLNVVIGELTNKTKMHESALIARGREIEHLEAEIKEAPKGGIDKLTMALVDALKKVSHEKAQETIETLCVKLGVDPHKLCIEEKAA